MKSERKKFLAEGAIPDVARMVEDIVGCKWSIAVLGRVREGVTRPGAIEHSLPGLTAKVLNERLRKLVRYGIVERTQFPELAETFYRVGPGATRLRLAEYLARETARGRLNTPEPDVAAEHFLGMLTGHSYMRRLLGLETAPTALAKARRIEAAVSKFLQAYAVEVTKIEARRAGHTVTEQPLEDGSIKLTLQVNGGAA